MLIQKIEYIHNNPIRRGYVDEPKHWRYSSAGDYEGLKGLLDVETDWYDDGRSGNRVSKTRRSQRDVGNEKYG